LVRWSCGALGLVPRRAQRLVILFFWPMRASSCHQISIAVPDGRRDRTHRKGTLARGGFSP
jgi:hypothetical protein